METIQHQNQRQRNKYRNSLWMTKYFPLDLWRAFTETKEEIPNEISLQSEFLYWFNQSESIFFFFIFSPPLFASVFPAIFLLYAGNLYFTFSKNHEIFKTINSVLGLGECVCVCVWWSWVAMMHWKDSVGRLEWEGRRASGLLCSLLTVNPPAKVYFIKILLQNWPN